MSHTKFATNLNLGFWKAIEKNYVKIMRCLIKCGANNFNLGLKGACFGGHKYIAKKMINLGATEFNFGLSNAAGFKHIRLVKLMLKHNADPESVMDINRRKYLMEHNYLSSSCQIGIQKHILLKDLSKELHRYISYKN